MSVPRSTWNHGTIRDVERESIREFVQVAADAGAFRGRVLDYGCGVQPYRRIVEDAGGRYYGFDRVSFPASVALADHGPDDWTRFRVNNEPGAHRVDVSWDAILCNQVVQYVPDVQGLLHDFRHALAESEFKDPGALVLTFPTSWDEVEPDDLWRFTRAGMIHLLEVAGFTVERAERRAEVELGGFRFPIGYGIIARA